MGIILRSALQPVVNLIGRDGSTNNVCMTSRGTLYHKSMGGAGWCDIKKLSNNHDITMTPAGEFKNGARDYNNLDWIDWVEVLHPVIHVSGYVRCPCEGYVCGSSWSPTQEMTIQMEITDRHVPFQIKLDFNWTPWIAILMRGCDRLIYLLIGWSSD